jgi:hypothetical protein
MVWRMREFLKMEESLVVLFLGSDVPINVSRVLIAAMLQAHHSKCHYHDITSARKCDSKR